jgi:glutathione S-transferase
MFLLSFVFATFFMNKFVIPLKFTSPKTVAQSLWKKSDLYKTDIHALLRCNCKADEPANFRLAYMPIRNRGEILRLILEEAQVPYEVEVIGFENWRNGVKATTPHGKVPVLRNFDGKGNDLGQEGAITRFLGAQLGLAGDSSTERAMVDSLYSLWFSTMRNNGMSHDGEHYSVAALRDCAPLRSATERPVYRDEFRVNSLSRANRSLMILGFWESVLEESKTGFLVKDKPTYVDLGLFYILFELAEEGNVPDFAEKFFLPHCGAFLSLIQERPQINAYLRSPTRMPRYARDGTGTSTYLFTPGKWSPVISSK